MEPESAMEPELLVDPAFLIEIESRWILIRGLIVARVANPDGEELAALPWRSPS